MMTARGRGHSDCNAPSATDSPEGFPTRRILPASIVLLAISPQACGDLPAGPLQSSSAGVSASGAAPHLAFVTSLPASGEANVVISPPVRVAVQDSLGNPLRGATDTVTLALAPNPNNAILLGSTTVAAIDGIATFADLRVDRPGSGYTLAATAARRTEVTSAVFVVRVTFASVNGGYVHTCGVTTGGAAYCWGDNFFGQLGDGTTAGRTTPVPVAGGLRFAAVSAGSFHTCGVTTGGAASCWGDNSSGQLGTRVVDHTMYRSSPGRVVGVHGFATVSAGNVHTCGMTTHGVAYCWGYNVWGQLGDGTTTQRSIPVPVTGGLRFAVVDAGSYFSCGVTTGGAAYCWGENLDGELGDGTTTSWSTPVPVSGVLNFAAVGAGWYHTCGMTTTAGAYCWGYNGHSQLGEGTTITSLTPVPVVQ